MIEPLILWSCVGLLALALLVSLFCLWRVRRLARLLAASAGWMPVEATVVESRIEWRGVGTMGGGYFPIVVYDYAFRGRAYRGWALTIGPPRGYDFHRAAQRVADRLAVGTRVTAWVDPSDPAQAVLDRRVPFRKVVLVMLVVLWTVTLGGIAVLLFEPGVVGPGPALRL